MAVRILPLAPPRRVECSVHLFVNNEPVKDVSPGGTLGDAIKHVQVHVCPPGYLVMGVQVDGREIPGTELAGAFERSAETLERVDVMTSTRGALVAEAMQQASASLEQTVNACAAAGEAVTEGRALEGIEALGECARAWQQIHQAVVHGMQMLDIDPAQVTVNDLSLMDAINRPREALNQIKEALLAQDHVLLADVLQYEFSEATQVWHTIIARIHQDALDQDAAYARK